MMINKIQTKLYFVSISIFIALIDQFTKYLMFNNKKLFINKDFLLFKLDFVKNYGAAFNIFSGSRIFLSLISILFSIILIYLIFRKNTLNPIDLYSYSFIQIIFYSQFNMFLYNLGKYSVGKIGYHFLMLFPLLLLIKPIESLKCSK